MRPQTSMGFGEKYLQAQECGQSYVSLSFWSKDNAGTHFEKSRRARIRGRFRSINAHGEQKRIKLRWTGYSAKTQERHCGGNGQWRCANKRGNTSFRSRSWSLRDSAMTKGNACCSIDWKTLRRPRIFLRVKTIIWKTRNFVPLVVPVLSANSGSNSSSTSTLQDLSSTSPAQERSDGLAQETEADHSQNHLTQKKRNGNRDSDGRLRDLPEWLEEFTDDPEDTEVHAPAHISQDSDSERPTKVVSKSRKHSIHIHFPSKKGRNREVCLRKNMTRAACRRRTGEALPPAEKFCDLTTADHKVLNEEGESRHGHRYAVVVQDLASQWIQSYPCKRKTLQETIKSLRMFLEPSHKPKVIYTDNSLEFGESLEDVTWNHRTSTPRRSETNGIAERAVRRVKEGTWAVLLQSGLDEKWWADSMECYCHLRSVQDVLAEGKTPYGIRFGEPFKGPTIPFLSNGWISPDFNTRSIKTSSIWQERETRNLSWVCIDRGEIWKGDILLRISRIGKRWAHQKIFLHRINAKEVLISHKGEEFMFPIADGTTKLSGRDYEFRESTPRPEQTVGSEDLSGELQGERGEPQPTEIRRWRWSPCRLLVDSRWLHLSSSQWTSSSPTLHAIEETFPFPMKYIDVTRSTHTDLDVMQEQRIDDYWNVDSNRSLSDSWRGFTKFTPKKKISQGIFVVWEEIDKSSNDYETRSCMAWSMEHNWESSSESRTTRMEKREAKLDNARRLRGIYSIDPDDEDTRKPFNIRGESWKCLWARPCRAKSRSF